MYSLDISTDRPGSSGVPTITIPLVRYHSKNEPISANHSESQRISTDSLRSCCKIRLAVKGTVATVMQPLGAGLIGIRQNKNISRATALIIVLRVDIPTVDSDDSTKFVDCCHSLLLVKPGQLSCASSRLRRCLC